MSIKNINTGIVAKSYTGTLPKNIAADNFKTGEKGDRDIKLFDYSNSLNFRKNYSYNVNEESKNAWKTVGFASLGTILLLGGIFICKKRFFNNKNVTKKFLSEAETTSKTNGIKPANLNDKLPENYIKYKETDGVYVKEFGYADTRIVESLNPKTLPVVKFPNKTMHISNFDAPNGSIAISSTFDKTISTDGLLQCAAVSFVDKRKNLQTLLHCCPGVEAERNRAILDYILSHSKASDLEITIVPGCYKSTDTTVSFLVDNIRDILGKKCKIDFANITPKHECIILKDGILSCTDKTRYLSESEINPVNNIIFSS